MHKPNDRRSLKNPVISHLAPILKAKAVWPEALTVFFGRAIADSQALVQDACNDHPKPASHFMTMIGVFVCA